MRYWGIACAETVEDINKSNFENRPQKVILTNKPTGASPQGLNRSFTASGVALIK